METVEVVIRIPKRTYDRVSERGIIAYGDDAYYIGHAIASGTVLPKGHGDLIEREKLLEQAGEIVTYCRQQEVDYDVVFVNDVEDAPTVIEADKEVENDG